jgi:hypothetical protein
MYRLDKLFIVESIFIYIFQPPEATEPPAPQVPFLENFAQPLTKNISVSKSLSCSGVQNYFLKWLEIRLICVNVTTCLPAAECCFIELAL